MQILNLKYSEIVKHNFSCNVLFINYRYLSMPLIKQF